jgi:hypothetical protein
MFQTDPNCLPALTMTARELEYRRLQALVIHDSEGTVCPVIVHDDEFCAVGAFLPMVAAA